MSQNQTRDHMKRQRKSLQAKLRKCPTIRCEWADLRLLTWSHPRHCCRRHWSRTRHSSPAGRPPGSTPWTSAASLRCRWDKEQQEWAGERACSLHYSSQMRTWKVQVFQPFKKWLKVFRYKIMINVKRWKLIMACVYLCSIIKYKCKYNYTVAM